MSKREEARDWLARVLDPEHGEALDLWLLRDGSRVFSTGELAYLRELAIDRRCATCRWAETRGAHETDLAEFPLECLVPSHGYAIDCAGPASLLVQPSFGCVQWQAKDDPAPETP